jgi:ethanolamine ammonia-lyase small subunit
MLVHRDPWLALRQFTAARIALGRVGTGLPTDAVLRFDTAHALARDAVHLPLDTAVLAADLAAADFAACTVQSRAPDRATYLRRPDLGRRLAPDAAMSLPDAAGEHDLGIVLADGLSAVAVQRHAVPVLGALRALLPREWRIAPVVVARQARVALGDEIGARLRARLVLVLIGERPGLSSPDSLGAYLTFAPEIGRTDAERNCVSNIRPEGLAYSEAARKLAWLMQTALRIALTGVELKDESDEAHAPPVSAPASGARLSDPGLDPAQRR